jgi:hypothetical protein
VADDPAAADPHDADPVDGAAPVERRDFGHVVFVIGPDAATVGRAVREESSGAAGRVLAFVGAPDHPALAEMLAELGAEATETPGS